MYKAVIFGGTTEGRLLHEFAALHKIPALTCVATDYGGELLSGGGTVNIGRLDCGGMAEILTRGKPALVIDATHPYAVDVSRNIKDACGLTDTEYLRVLRETRDSDNAANTDDGGGFETLSELVAKLANTEGGVFVTLGVKEARELTALPDYKNRLWLRILPSADGLSECLALGYLAARIICMQGPFSRELNLAMFRDSGARILVTKQSGGAGGFIEKISAARELKMEIFMLGRPAEPEGMSLERAKERLAAL